MAPIDGPEAARPIGGSCPKCGAIHDQTKCKGHKRIDDGWRQCRNNKWTDQDVCGSHGGRAPHSLAAAKARGTEREMRKTLGRLTSTPVTNPLLELQELAGEAKAWREVCKDHMAELERLRYSSAEGGEHIRGEVILFERALEACRKVLVDVARLDIDARLAAIEETQVRALEGVALAVLSGVLGDFGVAADSVEVRKRLLVHIGQATGVPVIEERVA